MNNRSYNIGKSARKFIGNMLFITVIFLNKVVSVFCVVTIIKQHEVETYTLKIDKLIKTDKIF